MTKYHVEIGDSSLQVEVQAPRGNVWDVTVDGVSLQLDLVDGHVLHGRKGHRCLVSTDANGQPQAVQLDGVEFAVRVENQQRRRVSGSGRPKTAGGQVVAPMNGQVVKVLQKAGGMVEKGDVVLVLEAMKMENEVTAPVSGRLVAVHIAPGATVKPGEPLFTVADA